MFDCLKRHFFDANRWTKNWQYWSHFWAFLCLWIFSTFDIENGSWTTLKNSSQFHIQRKKRTLKYFHFWKLAFLWVREIEREIEKKNSFSWFMEFFFYTWNFFTNTRHTHTSRFSITLNSQSCSWIPQWNSWKKENSKNVFLKNVNVDENRAHRVWSFCMQ